MSDSKLSYAVIPLIILVITIASATSISYTLGLESQTMPLGNLTLPVKTFSNETNDGYLKQVNVSSRSDSRNELAWHSCKDENNLGIRSYELNLTFVAASGNFSYFSLRNVSLNYAVGGSPYRIPIDTNVTLAPGEKSSPQRHLINCADEIPKLTFIPTGPEVERDGDCIVIKYSLDAEEEIHQDSINYTTHMPPIEWHVRICPVEVGELGIAVWNLPETNENQPILIAVGWNPRPYAPINASWNLQQTFVNVSNVGTFKLNFLIYYIYLDGGNLTKTFLNGTTLLGGANTRQSLPIVAKPLGLVVYPLSDVSILPLAAGVLIALVMIALLVTSILSRSSSRRQILAGRKLPS